MFGPDDPRSKWMTPEVVAAIEQHVAEAPPFTPAQRDRLRTLLHPPVRRDIDAA